MSVDLPTFGGPTRATNIGGGSNAVRSTSGSCSLLAFMSCVLYMVVILLVKAVFYDFYMVYLPSELSFGRNVTL